MDDLNVVSPRKVAKLLGASGQDRDPVPAGE
jgi:hypothetical protein